MDLNRPRDDRRRFKPAAIVCADCAERTTTWTLRDGIAIHRNRPQCAQYQRVKGIAPRVA